MFSPIKTTSIVIISTLVITGFGMGNPFDSQNSNLAKVASADTPQVTTTQMTPKTETAPDLTTLAEQAIKKGNFDLAEQYALKFARLNPDRPVEFINLMCAICHQRDSKATFQVTWNNGKSIRTGYGSRLNAIDKIIEQIDWYLNNDCKVEQISELLALKKEMNAEKAKMQNTQHDAFEAFAQNQYSKARNLCNEGKGKHWYNNDDETKFQDALVELLRAFTVIEQLDSDTREMLNRFETEMKSELNGSEFDAAQQRAALLYG